MRQKGVKIKTRLPKIVVEESGRSRDQPAMWRSSVRLTPIQNVKKVRHEHVVLLGDGRVTISKLARKIVDAWSDLFGKLREFVIIDVNWIGKYVSLRPPSHDVPLLQKPGHSIGGFKHHRRRKERWLINVVSAEYNVMNLRRAELRDDEDLEC